jgi:hypothetical protein
MIAAHLVTFLVMTFSRLPWIILPVCADAGQHQ